MFAQKAAAAVAAFFFKSEQFDKLEAKRMEQRGRKGSKPKRLKKKPVR